MKLTKTRRSASKAFLKMKRSKGIQKVQKRSKRSKYTSILSIVPDVDTVKKKTMKRTPTPEATSSSENFYAVDSAESSFRATSSRVPLVIDSPGVCRGRPAFSFAADVSFESSDGELSRTPKILQRKVMKKEPKQKKVKRKHSSSSTSLSSDEFISNQDKDIGLFPVREWGLLIIVLSHPTRVKLAGPALVQVISGSIRILGHVVESFHGIVPAFSSSKVMCLDIKTESSENICRQASLLQVVKNLLVENKVPDSMADRILNLCDNSSVIVGLRKNFKCSDVHFASSVMPDAFRLKMKKDADRPADFKDFGFKIYMDNSTDLDFPQCEDFITDVCSSIKDSDERNAAAPRIVVQGLKGVGKSTFLRYIINRVLNMFDAVYYLDGDPGQSEFTPGGCVSLVKVTAPLLGPPFTHQTTPEKMYFLRTVNVQDIADNYSICMQLLNMYYKEKCSVIPLFVNTMGWVAGTGLKLLKELKSVIDPTHIVKIVDNAGGGHGSLRADAEPMDCCAKEYIYDRFAPTEGEKVMMNPADRRNLSILSYLGKCQNLYSTVTSLNSITPYCIRWKDVALYVDDHKNVTEHVLYSFNGSWVALLSVNESLIMECDDPTLPKLLSDDPFGEDCYGFGVIRGIDIDKKVFYIVTPEPADRLKKVNAIVKGTIQLPPKLYTHQDAKKQLPYMTEITGESSIVSRSVPRRKYRPKRSETTRSEQ